MNVFFAANSFDAKPGLGRSIYTKIQIACTIIDIGTATMTALASSRQRAGDASNRAPAGALMRLLH